MKKIVTVFSLVILFSLCIIQPNLIYAKKAGGDFGGGSGNHSIETLPNGPYEHRSGWLYYMITADGKKQTTETIAITNSKMDMSIEKALVSRYGKPMSKLENSGNPAPWGLPYRADNSGRGPAVKKYLLDDKTTRNKKPRAYNFIYNNFKKDKAKAWEQGEELLIFEPFFWHVTDRGKPIFCGTTRTWAEKQEKLGWDYNSQANHETRYFVFKIEPGSTFLEGAKESKDAGFNIYSSVGNGYYKRSQIKDKKSNLGIGLVWSGKKPKGEINTYDGKHSHGNTEDPSKEKSKQGKTVIYKRYWEKKVDEKGETVYEKVKDYKRDNTTHKIIITDEKDKGANYRIIGWFTGKNTKDPQPTEDETQEK